VSGRSAPRGQTAKAPRCPRHQCAAGVSRSSDPDFRLSSRGRTKWSLGSRTRRNAARLMTTWPSSANDQFVKESREREEFLSLVVPFERALPSRLVFAGRTSTDATRVPFDLSQSGIQRDVWSVLHARHGLDRVVLGTDHELMGAALHDAPHRAAKKVGQVPHRALLRACDDHIHIEAGAPWPGGILTGIMMRPPFPGDSRHFRTSA